jgi:hypothetical protein
MRLITLALAAALTSTAPALAQPPVLAPIEELDDDRPEAWLMAHTAMVLRSSAVAVEQSRAAGAFELSFELGSIPHLSTEERTVGFGGLKPEHVNRSPGFARLGATVGIGFGWSAGLGWIPPIELDGARANVLALAFARPVVERPSWRIGVRFGAQRGELDGDFTCTADDVAGGTPGSPGNPFGCEAVSADEMTLRDRFVELGLASDLGVVDLHATLGFHQLELDFQVDALTFGFRDRTLLRADLDTWTFAVGASGELRPGTSLAAEIATTPSTSIASARRSRGASGRPPRGCCCASALCTDQRVRVANRDPGGADRGWFHAGTRSATTPR